MSTTIVVDTMVASAWLGTREVEWRARWSSVLEPARWVLPFVVVAEMGFGAEVAGWGSHRRGVLNQLIDRSGAVPPIDPVVDAYVDLRTLVSPSAAHLWSREFPRTTAIR